MLPPLQERLLDGVAFSFSAGIFTATVFYQLHFMSGLIKGVDSYSYRFMVNADLAQGIKDWNMLQAVLRRTSLALESSILVLLTTSLLMVCVSSVGIFLEKPSPGSWLAACMRALGPTALLVVSYCHVMVSAAEVTGRCRRVPPFVLSLYLTDDAVTLNERLTL